MTRKKSQPDGLASRARTDAFTFAMHWGMVAALIFSLLTGLRIATDYAESLAGNLAEPISVILPEGAVIEWHVWSSWALFFIAAAYATFLWWSRQAARVTANRSVLDRIRNARQSGTLWSSRSAWFAINVLVYWAGFVLIGFMIATGLMLYTGATFGLATLTLSTMHGLAAYAFLAYIAVHVLVQLKAGTFWKIFQPRMAYAGAGAVAVLTAGAAVAAIYVFDQNMLADLRISRIAAVEAPVLDGDPADGAWRQADAVTIHTNRGANLPNDNAPVQVKAVHDGERIYFRFRWPDPQRSQKHLPIVKTKAGWTVMQSEYETNDEDVYYEDKFAVVLSRSPDLASGTAHLGQTPLAQPHFVATRGLHYTTDGSYVDMWHWKSVRTGGMEPSFMDDDHFGPPVPMEKPGERYTAGYQQDPKESGGYTLNWTKVDEDEPLGNTLVVPKLLPADPRLLDRLGDVDLDPQANDEGVWYFTKDELVPYDPALDAYPVGTVMPSVIIEGPFKGDRADVRAGAKWGDGFWTLEAARALDTGSKYDVPLSKGKDTFLWVSVFNHTQTRHSQHLHPVRLVLE